MWVSRPKELHFFVGGEQREGNEPPLGNSWRGESWYRRHFVTDRRACGEVAPGYVLESAELDRNRDEMLGRLFGFIGVDAGFRSPRFSRRLFERRSRRFPNRFGQLVLRSPLVRLSERVLPFTVHEAVRNVLLAPFSAPEPDPRLPAAVEKSLRMRFRDEVDRARRLTRLPLASLGE